MTDLQFEKILDELLLIRVSLILMLIPVVACLVAIVLSVGERGRE